MNENTRFEEYERKTRKIILTIGIIAGIFFLFGLLVISSDEENYNPEETSPDFVENQNILPDVSVDTEPVFIDTEDTPVSERKKPIKVTPAQINMNKFILGVDTQNQSVLTIGTDGSESIHIERVELVEETEDGFEFRDKCRNRDLRGDETCNVLITWVPHLPGNVQNNFKIIWYETRLDKSSAKSEEVSIKGSAVYPEDTRQGCDASTGCSIGGDGIGAHRLAIGPNGEIIGYIDEAGNVHDRDGNIIGRVNEDGMVVDSDGNIIGVAQNMKLAYDKDGNIIGYVKTDGTVVDLQGEVIGKTLPDGTIVNSKGEVIGKAVEAGFVYDENGKIIGRVLPDGTVVDINDPKKIIGRLNENGEVVDENGNRQLRQGVTQGNVDELNRQAEEAMQAVDELFAQREITYQAWCETVADMTLEQLKQVLTQAEQELEDLEKNGGSSKELSVARSKVTTAKKKVETANAKNATNPDKRSIKEWEDLYKTLLECEKEFESIGNTVGGVAGEIISAAGGIVTSSLSMINGMIHVTTAAAATITNWRIARSGFSLVRIIKLVAKSVQILLTRSLELFR